MATVSDKNLDVSQEGVLEEILDSEDEVDDDNDDDVKQRLHQNTVTVLQPTNGPTMHAEVLNLAPGEGKTPVSTYSEPNWEALSFPKLFPNGRNTFNTKR